MTPLMSLFLMAATAAPPREPSPFVALLGLVVLVGLMALVAFALKRPLQFFRSVVGPAQAPFSRVPSLLTPAEMAFHLVLRAVVPERWTVFVKVRLIDLLHLPRGTPNARGLRNLVQSKHVDFVVCDFQTLRPLLVIELDDASHLRRDRQERDRLVDRILRGAGLPILHVAVRSTYDPIDLQRQIDAALTSAMPSAA